MVPECADSESSNIWNSFLDVQIHRNVAKSIVMKITVEPKPAGQVEAEALIVPVFEGRRDARFGAASRGDFEPDRYKTGDDKKSIDGVARAASTPGLEAAVQRGRILAEAQN